MSEPNKEMTFLEHLEELRWHIIRSAIVIVVIAILAFIFKEVVFDVILLGPSQDNFITNRLLCRLGEVTNISGLCIKTKPFLLQSIEMAGQFTAHIKISIITGLIISSPYIVYELWKFISPALYFKERKAAQVAIVAISLLFFLGVLFGYFIISPLAVKFLLNYKISELAQNNIRLMSYISTVTGISLAAGVTFELPVVVFFFSKIGLITPQFLRKYRRHAIIVILLIAAIITPSPDIFSQILVAIPLMFLYEISIVVSRRVNLKRDKENINLNN
jgi:sec-independent protein translocase protein TatC